MKRRFLLPALSCLLLLPLSAVSAQNSLSDSEKRSGWRLLFNGESFDGWRNYKKDGVSDGWKISDGAMVRSGRGAGDIISAEKFGEFELSLEYKISKGGNSGLMFHVVEGDGPPWHSGPEIQVQDNVDGHDPQLAGWLYQLYRPAPASKEANAPAIDSTRPVGQWNQLYVRIAKDQCEVCMNGVRYYRFKLGDKNWDSQVAKSKFAKFEGFGKAGEGHICLQDHGNEVAYRNVKVRKLGPGGTVPQPIDSKLEMKGELAFPNLKWDLWEPFDDAGRLRPLRLMELTYAKGDGNRLFAASQIGAIWSFKNDPEVEESTLFLDLRGKVKDWKKPGANEQGLLGLAMHPEFTKNGKFYVHYSLPNDQGIVSEFQVSKSDPSVADPASERILMKIDQPYANHNGGCIEFGPDGYLYIAMGDGGFRNDPHSNGQNLGTLLGSVLRIDVNKRSGDLPYAIPSDNPFVNQEGARGEIYAYGIRNAWRIAFDKSTGALWLADVGQELWEEINVVTKGGNYGWSIREGFHPFGNGAADPNNSDPIDPVWEYDHRVGRSITGGRVYRSSREQSLHGKYLYADYVTGTVWALSYDAKSGKATKNEQVVPESIPVLAFGEDANGEVYYLTNNSRGECIYRFTSK